MNHRIVFPASMLNVLLGLTVLLLPLGASSQMVPPQSLVRVDLSGLDMLRDLAQNGIMVYAQLYPPQGGMRLLLPAGPELQQALQKAGARLQVLDADISEASYYLLGGEAVVLQQVATPGRLWQLEERLAVARLQPDELAVAVASGLKVQPLSLRPLAIPHPDVLARSVEAPLAPVLTPDPLVSEMIAQVTTSQLFQYNGDLSGEWPALVAGSPYTIATRYTFSGTPIQKATRYVYDHLAALGLNTSFHYYNLWGGEYRNVVAEQPGQTQPNRIYLITAHLDSITYTSPGTFAPGSDDNASGSTGVLVAADILSQYAFGCTLRYVLFTGEEQGLYGSQAYANEIAGQNVQGVLNLDMIGYNTPGSAPSLELHTRFLNSSDLAIANLFQSVITTYQLNLAPYLLQDGETFSDHASFWNVGFPAILAIEDWDDHTPSYHKNGDQLETLDLAYYTEFAKAAVATFAHLGCLLEGQLSGVVYSAETLLPLAGAEVRVESTSGKVRTVFTGADGSYRLTLPPGLYGVTASLAGYQAQLAAGVSVVHGQTTTQNFYLQLPCTAISDPRLSVSPAFPAVGQMATFSASVGSGTEPLSYTWNFGDSSSAIGAVVTHSYTAPGSYLVTLTAENPCGPAQTAGQTVYIGRLITFFPLLPKGQLP